MIPDHADVVLDLSTICTEKELVERLQELLPAGLSDEAFDQILEAVLEEAGPLLDQPGTVIH